MSGFAEKTFSHSHALRPICRETKFSGLPKMFRSLTLVGKRVPSWIAGNKHSEDISDLLISAICYWSVKLMLTGHKADPDCDQNPSSEC